MKIKRNPKMSSRAYTGRFHCVNTVTGLSTQSEYSPEEAARCCKILNDHDVRNGHPPVHEVQEETPD